MEGTSMSRAEDTLVLTDGSWCFLKDAREPKYKAVRKTEVAAPNTGAGQDFKGVDEQKEAQANELLCVQLSHFAPTWGCWDCHIT